MSTQVVHIHFLSNNNENQISISKSLYNEFNIKQKEPISLQFGHHKIESVQVKTETKENIIYLTQKIKKELKIPFTKKILVKFEESTLRLGPLIGIFTTNPIEFENNQVVMKREKDFNFYKKILLLQLDQPNIIFIFNPKNINWLKNTVTGFFLEKTSQGEEVWRKEDVPIPDVIYNRVISRRSEKSEEVREFRHNLELKSNAKLFNPHFFNKATIHNLLIDNDKVNQFLPKTVISPSVLEIKEYLKKYKVVYLKPMNRAGGWGIYKIAVKKRHYILQFGSTVLKYRTLSEILKHHIKRWKLTRYLLQQGINLIKINERQVDFRLNINKNQENKWIVVGSAAKMAGTNSVTTHVRLGGEIYSSKEMLNKYFKNHAAQIEEKLNTTANILAEEIEKGLDIYLGELGFDIGVDQKGQIWMLEANSIPGRTIFNHPSLESADSQSIRYIINYATYLAKFT